MTGWVGCSRCCVTDQRVGARSVSCGGLGTIPVNRHTFCPCLGRCFRQAPYACQLALESLTNSGIVQGHHEHGANQVACAGGYAAGGCSKGQNLTRLNVICSHVSSPYSPAL